MGRERGASLGDQRLLAHGRGCDTSSVNPARLFCDVSLVCLSYPLFSPSISPLSPVFVFFSSFLCISLCFSPPSPPQQVHAFFLLLLWSCFLPLLAVFILPLVRASLVFLLHVVLDSKGTLLLLDRLIL